MAIVVFFSIKKTRKSWDIRVWFIFIDFLFQSLFHYCIHLLLRVSFQKPVRRNSFRKSFASTCISPLITDKILTISAIWKNYHLIYSLTNFLISCGTSSPFIILTNPSAIVSAPSNDIVLYLDTPEIYLARTSRSFLIKSYHVLHDSNVLKWANSWRIKSSMLLLAKIPFL